MSDEPDSAASHAPAVEAIESGLGRWTFGTADREEQDRQFRYWCGYFGYDETDEPERVEGRVWWIRQRQGKP